MGRIMKQSPNDFYHAQIEQYSREIKKLKKQLALSSTLRILLFLLVCFGVYFTFGSVKWVIAIIVVGIIAFVVMVIRHNNLQYQRNLKSALITYNETEIKVLLRNFKELPDGSQFKNPEHAFCQDIDLFGRGSFYQYLNRTALESGSQFLASILLENDINQISEKQKSVQELASLPKWRQHFWAVASLIKTEISAERVVKWLHDYNAFTPSWISPVSTGFTILSVGLLGAYFLGFVSGFVVFGWFLLGLSISGRYFKKVNNLEQHTSKIQDTFKQFHKLISEIEQQEFSSTILAQKKKRVLTESKKASLVLKQFAKNLDALDQRNNMLVGVIANGFMLRDLSIANTIEKWIANYNSQVKDWFEVIVFFDAYNSLGNYVFNHQNHVFPRLTNESSLLTIEGSGHPLLPPDKMVRNNFEINREEFFIITGANMAGKSTFLRTVSLHIVMANIGLPVCATSAKYNPIKLITSMRTTDSLTDDESYFFSELKRLKFIVEAIESDEYFIILDEILKGTNSTDKAIGSRKFIEKLVAGNSTGIVATHDLSLCEVAKELPTVKNYYFDARIEDGELYFDYTIKPGVCKNMNASFLLKKMNIID
jgi:DNA mismatch repair ATPase MutS